MIRAYRAYEDGIVEIGEITRERIAALLKEAEASLDGRAFALGLCRSEQDFVEIAPVGKSQYLIMSDRIAGASKSWIGRIFSGSIESTVTGGDAALKVAYRYFDESRPAFEASFT